MLGLQPARDFDLHQRGDGGDCTMLALLHFQLVPAKRPSPFED
jgi:hypothetical protein